jgi:hypothetical protein
MVAAPPDASGVSSARPPGPAPVVETECRPDLAMPSGMVSSAEARSSPVPGLRVDAAAAQAVQSAEERPEMAMPAGPGRSKVICCATVHKQNRARERVAAFPGGGRSAECEQYLKASMA